MPGYCHPSTTPRSWCFISTTPKPRCRQCARFGFVFGCCLTISNKASSFTREGYPGLGMSLRLVLPSLKYLKQLCATRLLKVRGLPHHFLLRPVLYRLIFFLQALIEFFFTTNYQDCKIK